MGLRINASLSLMLPDEPSAIAATLGEIAVAWTAFTNAVGQHKGGVEIEFTIVETRAPAVRRKRGIGKKAVAAPIETVPEAA